MLLEKAALRPLIARSCIDCYNVMSRWLQGCSSWRLRGREYMPLRMSSKLMTVRLSRLFVSPSGATMGEEAVAEEAVVAAVVAAAAVVVAAAAAEEIADIRRQL
jgi:hypothetical protein